MFEFQMLCKQPIQSSLASFQMLSLQISLQDYKVDLKIILYKYDWYQNLYIQVTKLCTSRTLHALFLQEKLADKL